MAGTPTPLLCLSDFQRVAEATVDPSTFAFFAGGAADERALASNTEAFARRALRPRALTGSGPPTTAVSLLGRELALPVLAAPLGLLTLLDPDGEHAAARAAGAVGTVACTSWLSTSTPARIAAAAPDTRLWSQLYILRDRALMADLAHQAAAAGFEALVISVDGPVLGRRETATRAGFAMPATLRVGATAAAAAPEGLAPAEVTAMLDPDARWDDLAELARASGLPLVVKGILTHEDAVLAVDHGAAAVVVSNHGGRQLDAAPATLDVLEEVVEAVAGRIPVLLDGGVRRGTDVVVALALGARAVLVGRPVAWGLATAGQAGVEHVLTMLREEIAHTLTLCGLRSPEEIPPHTVMPRGAPRADGPRR